MSRICESKRSITGIGLIEDDLDLRLTAVRANKGQLLRLDFDFTESGFFIHLLLPQSVFNFAIDSVYICYAILYNLVQNHPVKT